MKTPEQIENLQILRPFWFTLDPSAVFLSCWTGKSLFDRGRCGTIACIGGWVAQMPQFQAKGVKRDYLDGAPYMGEEDTPDYLGPRGVARVLFGDSDFFSAAGIYERVHGLPTEGSDWEIALRRIDHALTDTELVPA